MALYRKKPVVIEAVTWHGKYASTEEWPDWFNVAFRAGDIRVDPFGIGDEGPLVIKTLEGEMRAGLGDRVIQGVKGEIYPCKPDIFAIIYEPV